MEDYPLFTFYREIKRADFYRFCANVPGRGVFLLRKKARKSWVWIRVEKAPKCAPADWPIFQAILLAEPAGPRRSAAIRCAARLLR